MNCFLDLIFFKQTFSKNLRPIQTISCYQIKFWTTRCIRLTHMHIHFRLIETPLYELCRLFPGAFKYITVWKLQRHAIFRYDWTMSKILNHHMFSCPIFNSFNIKKTFTSYPIYVSKFSWSQFWMLRSCLHAPLYVFFHISYYKERHLKNWTNY